MGVKHAGLTEIEKEYLFSVYKTTGIQTMARTLRRGQYSLMTRMEELGIADDYKKCVQERKHNIIGKRLVKNGELCQTTRAVARQMMLVDIGRRRNFNRSVKAAAKDIATDIDTFMGLLGSKWVKDLKENMHNLQDYNVRNRLLGIK